jgi:hypothetical protein
LANGRKVRQAAVNPSSNLAAARTVDGLWNAIGRFVDCFTPQDCAKYFATCGYDADRSANALIFRCRNAA